MSDDDGMMDKLLTRGLLMQVQMQIQFLLRSERLLAEELSRPPIPGTIPVVGPFFAIHNALSAAGCISKALWGQRGEKGAYYTARMPLRESLELDDSSPFYPLLDVRNGFEHFDERLTTWLKNRNHGPLVDCNIGPEERLINIEFTPLRHYRPDTGVVRILDFTFDLRAVIQEARRIAPKVDAMLEPKFP